MPPLPPCLVGRTAAPPPPLLDEPSVLPNDPELYVLMLRLLESDPRTAAAAAALQSDAEAAGLLGASVDWTGETRPATYAQARSRASRESKIGARACTPRFIRRHPSPLTPSHTFRARGAPSRARVSQQLRDLACDALVVVPNNNSHEGPGRPE